MSKPRTNFSAEENIAPNQSFATSDWDCYRRFRGLQSDNSDTCREGDSGVTDQTFHAAVRSPAKHNMDVRKCGWQAQQNGPPRTRRAVDSRTKRRGYFNASSGTKAGRFGVFGATASFSTLNTR
jgi:hypothetical protein